MKSKYFKLKINLNLIIKEYSNEKKNHCRLQTSNKKGKDLRKNVKISCTRKYNEMLKRRN